MRQFQQQQAQPQQPPMTTPTGQMVPGLNKAQKLEVLLTSGLKGSNGWKGKLRKCRDSIWRQT